MPFVKLDCGMLDSTLWIDRAARELFITALLMAEPIELRNEACQIEVSSLRETGFRVPPGWYGFVPAAGIGIVRRCGMENELGMEALTRLGEPEQDSRTPDFDGRRMVRIDGGYLILNYDKYRQKDYTAAERQKRYREKKALRVGSVTLRATSRDVTQAEAEAEGKVENTERAVETPTLAVVLAVAANIGVPDTVATTFWNEMEGIGWVDRGHRPIKRWQNTLKSYANKWQANDASRQRPNGLTTQPPKKRWAEPDLS